MYVISLLVTSMLNHVFVFMYYLAVINFVLNLLESRVKNIMFLFKTSGWFNFRFFPSDDQLTTATVPVSDIWPVIKITDTLQYIILNI